MPEQPDLIDQILPSSRVHLIGGSSNAGKTRFLLPMLLEWQAGRPVLGYTSNPVPWAYIVGDRLLVEAHDTCRSMAINPERIPMVGAFGDQNKSVRDIFEIAAKRKLGLLVWEGFSDFCRGDRKKEIRDFMSAISAHCHSKEYFNGSLTILGVMESPKLKPHERYDNPRERISGVASWGYHSSSVFLIESDKPADIESPNRIMYCSLKNTSSFMVGGGFDDNGRLCFMPVPVPYEAPTKRKQATIQ